MDNKRELNDILISGDENKVRDSKKLVLLIIAIVVLLIIMAIIVMLMSQNNDETIVLPSQAVDTNIPNDGFSNVPVDTGAQEERFEEIVKEIKNRQNAIEPTTPQAPQIQAPQAQAPKPAAPKPQAQAPKPAIKATPKPSLSVQNRLNNGDIAENGYYLQVGAFSRTPSREFLNNIDKYSYRIQEVMVNSNIITRYLVGPYPSKAAAEKDFASVAQNIAKPVHLRVN